MAGSVSGGCVESGVFARAMTVLDTGRPSVASYGIDDESAFAAGLSCGGAIDVLIEPFVPTPAWERLRQSLDASEAAAWAVGVAPEALLGRHLVVLEDGATVGSIHAAVDGEVAAEGLRLLADGGARVVELPVGEVFVEAFPRPMRLFIVGATHVAAALSRVARRLGFHVTVVDARGMYATEERFPDAHELVRARPEQLLADARLDARSYVVTLTHDRKFDIPVLGHALRSEARYVGAMGSRRTRERRMAELRGLGLGEAQLARLRSPIGLDLGASTPEEIAISIASEMLAVRSGREARPLVHKQGPVHGPATSRASRPFLSAVILAAGGSTRMGRPKQLLPLAGRPLLQHVLDNAAAAGLDEIVLVLGHAAEDVRSGVSLPTRVPVRVVVNDGWEAGISTSLRAGLRGAHERAAAAVVLLGDQPGVTALLVAHVTEAFLDSGRLAARPVWRGARGRRVPGHPVVLARDAWWAMDGLRGEEGARAVLAAHPEWLFEVPIAGAPPRDIDDPDDYRQALAAAGCA
jgi:xanthine dehydrogenase accessory factor